jgi:hypothetical protein
VPIPNEEETAFRLLANAEFDALTHGQKIAYLNRAIKVLTLREGGSVTVAVIGPDKKK